MVFTHTYYINYIPFELTYVQDGQCQPVCDDGKILIWNQTSAELLRTIEAHSEYISVLTAIGENQIVTGSLDRTIKVWDITTGECLCKRESHNASVRWITWIPSSKNLVSIGNDHILIAWNYEMEIKCKFKLSYCEDSIHAVISLGSDRMVIASDLANLLVYSIEVEGIEQVLQSVHRDSIQHLIWISPTRFASGSLDGAVVLYSHYEGIAIQPLSVFNYHQNYFEKTTLIKRYSYRVEALKIVESQFLIVAIRNGFAIYDTISGDCLLDLQDAHSLPIIFLSLLYSNTVLITAGEDGKVRLWQIKKNMDEWLQLSRPTINSLLIAELHGHRDSIVNLVSLNDDSFASAGEDNCVIIWKDTRISNKVSKLTGFGTRPSTAARISSLLSRRKIISNAMIVQSSLVGTDNNDRILCPIKNSTCTSNTNPNFKKRFNDLTISTRTRPRSNTIPVSLTFSHKSNINDNNSLDERNCNSSSQKSRLFPRRHSIQLQKAKTMASFLPDYSRHGTDTDVLIPSILSQNWRETQRLTQKNNLSIAEVSFDLRSRGLSDTNVSEIITNIQKSEKSENKQ